MQKRVLAAALLAPAAMMAWQAPATKEISSFDGLSGADSATLAVGPDCVVELSGSRWVAFDQQGKALGHPAPVAAIFKGFGGACETRAQGPAGVAYDAISGRWVWTLAVTTRIEERSPEPFAMCFAVSANADIAGPYYRFQTRRKVSPGDARIAVWPDGYYTADRNYTCAADRSKMLAGKPATEQCVAIEGASAARNASVEGRDLPAEGAPNLVTSTNGESDAVRFWQFHLDWANPKNTRLSETPREQPTPWLRLPSDGARPVLDGGDGCTRWRVDGARIRAERSANCLRGTVAGTAFLDLNHDGKRQDGEPGIAGRDIAFSGAGSGKVATGTDGAYRLSLPADPAFADPIYSVGGREIHLKAGETVAIDFPSVCTAQSSGAVGAKFWIGSQGEEAVNHRYGEWKKLISHGLYLVTPDGARFLPKRYVQFRVWMRKPPSALLATQAIAGLNAEVGKLDPKATVLDPIVGDWVSIHSLIERVSAAYLTHKAAALDAYKPLLDALNANTATVTPSDPTLCGR